jgi:hypothetical protein
MFTDNEEAGYLQRRVDVSLGMARAAAGDCARMAHEALAAGYGRRLAALRRIPQPRPSPASPEAAGKIGVLRTPARATGLLVGA